MARVTLGRIVGVFGIKGWIKAQSYTRPIENLLQYRRWWLTAEQAYEARVVEARAHGNVVVAALTDAAGTPIADRDLAAALVGAEIQVERAALPALPEGQFYWVDLIGLQVRSTSGAVLGTVTELMDNGAQDVLIVADGDVQRLIPFVRGPIIQSVDLQGGVIVAEWEPDY